MMPDHLRQRHTRYEHGQNGQPAAFGHGPGMGAAPGGVIEHAQPDDPARQHGSQGRTCAKQQHEKHARAMIGMHKGHESGVRGMISPSCPRWLGYREG